MSDVKRLLEEAVAAALEDCLGPPADGMSAAMRRAIVATAVDNFPAADYERAADKLASLIEGLRVTRDDSSAAWTQNGTQMASAPVSWFEAAIASGDAALARLADEVPA